MKVGVFGTGTMGSGIIQQFLQSGHEVKVFSERQTSLDRVKATLEKSFGRLVEKGKLEEAKKEEFLKNMTLSSSKEDFKECELIVEAAAENMADKIALFSALDEILPEDTILASNTSSLSITEIASATKHPGRVIGMHFFNPVPVMALVEVIKGASTCDTIKDKVIEISKQLGKTPVVVEEAPGFVVNRILIPMINEAVGILADGVATAEDIDTAMKLGANHPIGPLALGDLIGLDVCLNIMDVLYNEYQDPKYRAHNLLRKMVRAGLLGRKTKKGFFDYNK
ncbi:3-hydroxybutyryl-CoA dehydrogenase [Guggenheimella bovis]